MSNQFKIFIKFALLATIFVSILIIADKFGKDFGLLVIPEIVLFLALVWYKVFYLNPKGDSPATIAQNSVEIAGNVPISYSPWKQLISSLMISFIVFLAFVFLGFFIISFFLSSFILNFPPLIMPIRVAALALFVYAVIRWVSAIKYSVKVRGNEVARQAVDKQIIILASAISISACLTIASLGYWAVLLLFL